MKRHLEIIRFVPESFWRLKLNLPSGVDMSATKKQKERKDDDDDDDDDGDEIGRLTKYPSGNGIANAFSTNRARYL